MDASWVFNPLSHNRNSYSNKILFYFFVFLRLHPWHMEVPRLGVKLELQLLAYTAATATWDPSRVCDLHHSSQECLNPLSEARDQTGNLWFLVGFVNHCATTRTPTMPDSEPAAPPGNSRRFKSWWCSILSVFSFVTYVTNNVKDISSFSRWR